MAAHALTIARQFLDALREGRHDFEQIKYALGHAPGWDVTLNYTDPEGARYRELLDLCDAKDVEGLIRAFSAWVAVLEPVLRHFASLEEYNEARRAFVRYGKPYWKRRSATWEAGRGPMPTEDRAPHYRS